MLSNLPSYHTVLDTDSVTIQIKNWKKENASASACKSKVSRITIIFDKFISELVN
jgi:hypothetical protein